MIRRGFIAGIVAAFTAGALVATGVAVSGGLPFRGGSIPPATGFEVTTVGQGTLVNVTPLDLTCEVFAKDPKANDPGPVMYCARKSALEKSTTLSISKYHVRVVSSAGATLYTADRSP
jgi:hypothetical protein